MNIDTNPFYALLIVTYYFLNLAKQSSHTPFNFRARVIQYR